MMHIVIMLLISTDVTCFSLHMLVEATYWHLPSCPSVAEPTFTLLAPLASVKKVITIASKQASILFAQ